VPLGRAPYPGSRSEPAGSLTLGLRPIIAGANGGSCTGLGAMFLWVAQLGGENHWIIIQVVSRV